MTHAATVLSPSNEAPSTDPKLHPHLHTIIPHTSYMYMVNVDIIIDAARYILTASSSVTSGEPLSQDGL